MKLRPDISIRSEFLNRMIQRQILNQLSRDILKGNVGLGSHVFIEPGDNALVFKVS